MRTVRLATPLVLACATSLAVLSVPFTPSHALAQGTESADAVSTGTLTVTFTDFRKANGQILFAVYAEGTWDEGEPVSGAEVNLAEGQTTVTIEGLPAGRYGIKAFHDANGNGEMDMNPFGMPTEAFAFSNNAPASMGPAKWADAAFELTAEGATQSIRIR